jgi:acetyl-CoA synthetase
MSERLRTENPIAWSPTDDVIARAQLTRFISSCECATFDDLYRRSVEDVEWFTERVLRFLNIQFDRPYEKILDLSRGPEWPRWLVGGRLNIVKSCLDRWEDTQVAHKPAVIWEGEEGEIRDLTYAELLIEVERCAAGLRACGYGKGDAIGIHLPMILETVVALLAVNRIGGIAAPIFSGYGAAAIASRLRDAKAKALFTCDAFPRRGKAVNAKQVADEAVADCPEITRMIVARRMRVTVPMKPGRDLTWDQLLSTGDKAGGAARQPEPTGAEDPLIAIYTSGTTGKPKGVLHTHCGFPVKSAQDMCFGTDVGQGTRISWITDIGWMMGPWLIYGSLILGATIVLYDGAPDYPDPDRMWEFCERHGVEVLGISPTLVRALAAHGDSWTEKHALPTLRVFGSTGEPWNPAPWWWLFERVGRGRAPIINYSGGTEISGGILMGNPLLPIKPCAFSAPCPGIAADVVDENAQSIQGAVGELVIRKPWIGQARGFWKDDERYLQTYWSRWPGLWVHGDWAMIDDDGHWYILGRSDDTLKIAGKRVGPAEVESVLVGHESVVEAAAIGIPDELKGAALIAFCVLADVVETATLEGELKDLVAKALGKPLRPEKIYFVPALPKTRNAKVMRRVIRSAFLGEDPGDTTALENPAALESIRRAAGQS